MALALFIKSLSYLSKLTLVTFTLAMLTLANAKADTVLIYGDSLSASYGMPQAQGWVNLLQKMLPQHQIINASVSGETTAGGLQRLPALLNDIKPDLIFIELGGNDGLRGFPINQLTQNVTSMVQLAQASGAKVLLSEVMVPPNYGPRYAKQFNQVFQKISDKESIVLVPFFMTQIATEPSLMQADGIHPNTDAQTHIQRFMQPWIVNNLN